MYNLGSDLQKIFDKVCLHLDQQGHQAGIRNAHGTLHCLYRAQNGDKCAVGCLIPDKSYTDQMENQPVYDLFHGSRPYLRGSDEVKELVESLQVCHDEPDDWSETKRRLIDSGLAFGLDLSLVNSLEFNPR